jgi:dihydroneopterin aldolase
MDKIIARGLTFQACHGVAAQEKTTPQTFRVDLELGLDLLAAGITDDLASTVNYDRVYHWVEEIVTQRSYNLIEALAEEIAATLLARFARLQTVQVTVYKPEAPVQGEFEYFAVQISRTQK